MGGSDTKRTPVHTSSRLGVGDQLIEAQQLEESALQSGRTCRQRDLPPSGDSVMWRVAHRHGEGSEPAQKE
ncbi:hypothetical protein AAFF_G00093440 [Aldrovandia affinis]|uniref:Uncharacterized protein n=1 Tax=Aldrovandia affinis TaxID=143900 RepID=A0AAD7T2V1_9TELE|nr:hypothetical protein AAFF_G00093440 [Aldrovandia affinis]